MQHNAERHASSDETGQYNGLITEAFGQSNSELCDFFCKSLCAPIQRPVKQIKMPLCWRWLLTEHVRIMFLP
ncbi:Uncharacterised protein [Enterobacter hormaechei]|nr:Uncharacterised protein [Enterobacter hormaechei]CZV72243.1 Uncharacterised protein [Enterobacter hormaechei]SAB28511.1 Uncharacterised protein [Enterobacter hormaechei]